jgi:hypothetical protein
MYEWEKQKEMNIHNALLQAYTHVSHVYVNTTYQSFPNQSISKHHVDAVSVYPSSQQSKKVETLPPELSSAALHPYPLASRMNSS